MRYAVRLLENVVEGNGNAASARVPGVRVAGKTGTADFEGDAGHCYYASFVGGVLDPSPRFVALVGLEVAAEKATGPSAAAPAFSRIAARILADRSTP